MKGHLKLTHSQMFNFWLIGWFSRKVYSPWFCTMGDDWGKGERATRVPGETPPRRPALQTGDTRSVPRQNLNPGPLHSSGDKRVPYKWILWDRRLTFYQKWSHIFGDMYGMKHTTNATEVRNFSTSDSLPQAPQFIDLNRPGRDSSDVRASPGPSLWIPCYAEFTNSPLASTTAPDHWYASRRCCIFTDDSLPGQGPLISKPAVVSNLIAGA